MFEEDDEDLDGFLTDQEDSEEESDSEYSDDDDGDYLLPDLSLPDLAPAPPPERYICLSGTHADDQIHIPRSESFF